MTLSSWAARVMSKFWAYKSGDMSAWQLWRRERQRQDLDEDVKKQKWSWYLSCEKCLDDLDSLYIRFELSSVAEDIPDGLRRFALVQLCISNRPRGLHIEANDQPSPEHQRTSSRPRTSVAVLVKRCSGSPAKNDAQALHSPPPKEKTLFTVNQIPK